MIVIDDVFYKRTGNYTYKPFISIQGRSFCVRSQGINNKTLECKEFYEIRPDNGYFGTSYYTEDLTKKFVRSLKRALFIDQFRKDSNYRLSDNVDLEINNFTELKDLIQRASDFVNNPVQLVDIYV